MRITTGSLVFWAAVVLAVWYGGAGPRQLGQPTFLYVVAAALLAPYVAGPVMVHRTQRTSLEPTFQAFDPLGPDAPPELTQAYNAIQGELARLGFAVVQSYSNRSVNNAVGYITLFQNRKTAEVARLLVSVSVRGVVRNAAVLFKYNTDFGDDSLVLTYNGRSPWIYPRRPPPYHAFNFPDVTDPGRLLELHRALVRRIGGGQIRRDPLGADPDAYLRRTEYLQPQAYHMACGYSYRDEAAGVQRPTWKGAILVTWKLLWPLKPLGLALRRNKARRLLRELEAEGSVV